MNKIEAWLWIGTKCGIALGGVCAAIGLSASVVNDIKIMTKNSETKSETNN